MGQFGHLLDFGHSFTHGHSSVSIPTLEDIGLWPTLMGSDQTNMLPQF